MIHGVAIPLKSDDRTRRSSQDEALDQIGDKILDGALSGYRYEHEICYHSLTSGKSDFVELSPHLTGLPACTCRGSSNLRGGKFELPPPGTRPRKCKSFSQQALKRRKTPFFANRSLDFVATVTSKVFLRWAGDNSELKLVIVTWARKPSWKPWLRCKLCKYGGGVCTTGFRKTHERSDPEMQVTWFGG